MAYGKKWRNAIDVIVSILLLTGAICHLTGQRDAVRTLGAFGVMFKFVASTHYLSCIEACGSFVKMLDVRVHDVMNASRTRMIIVRSASAARSRATNHPFLDLQ